MGFSFGHRLRAPSSCSWQSCNLVLPLTVHASQQHRLAQRSCVRVSVDSKGVSGSNEFTDDTGLSNNTSSSSAGQQRSSWGSSWKRKASGQSPRSYFNRTQKDSHVADGSGQPSSGSAGRAAADAAHVDPQLEASIRHNVDKAADTLQEIITEVLNDMLVEEASSYVMGEQGQSIEINQAVRNAVVKRLEWLDSNFLAALNAYLAAPSVQHNKELSDLLRAVRNEVLDLVATRLPPSVQVLNSALQHSGRAGRAAIVQIALSGGEGAVPGVSLDVLGAAAHQLVDDMEDQQVVADRVLLARLVLLREELRMRAEQQAAELFWAQAQASEASNGEQMQHTSQTTSSLQQEAPDKFFGYHRSNLPVRCATFLKELLSVPERDRRLGLLSKAFDEDWVTEGSKGTTAQQPPTVNRGLKDTSSHQHKKADSLDIVRPGRFMSTLHAMRAGLEDKYFGWASTETGAPNVGILHQLDAIKFEALVALDRLQNTRPTANEPGHYDYEAELLSGQ